VAHGNAVIHRNGVELLAHPADALDFPNHQLAEFLEMHMARDKLGEGVRESLSFIPVARHRARAPAMLRPAVLVRER
jgi:hypothetical protein